MKTVFLLVHLHIMDDESEDIKIIGIYSSFEEGKSAIKRLSKQPGFLDFPDLIGGNDFEDYISGFYLTKYTLGEDNWKEGFATI